MRCADVELVQITATRVLTTALQIVEGLGAEPGVDLRPNPIAAVLNDGVQRTEPDEQPRLGIVGTTDDTVHRHLAAGRLDLRALVASIPAIETPIAADFADDPEALAMSSPRPAPLPMRQPVCCAHTDSTTTR